MVVQENRHFYLQKRRKQTLWLKYQLQVLYGLEINFSTVYIVAFCCHKYFCQIVVNAEFKLEVL